MSLPPISDAERERIFGHFNWEPIGAPGGDIRILGGWAAKNIVAVECPQLVRFNRKRVWMHRLVAKPFLELWQDWDDSGLLSDVLAWNGGFNPRFIRGSSTRLSNHSYGTAFDINAAWNGLGHTPPAEGVHGSVRRLVPIAEKHGWFWGGNWPRLDGMHFEHTGKGL